ncbi:MAG: patatin-like phospholipase family protein [Solirubrobacterales bacterium]|nr:patatin-like phospholipase family protein [Solirubrobacterales bacterium]MBV9917874.1 patatin-like phospholipase family protein [Solirubrobacterales bacterium]
MSVATSADEKRVDLVFEGGGVKGIGLAGAFCHLDAEGYRPQRVAGTSAGAITAALVAAGYGRDELEPLVLEELKYKKFEDGAGGLIGAGLQLLRHKGLHPGNYFEGWMRERLEATGFTRFGQLKMPPADGEDPAAGAQYRLQVIASDLTHGRMLVLPRDAREHLNVDPDELEIARAVRMSMSIPLFFNPVVYQDPRNANDKHVIVDGGILSNFPVWLFDCPPDHPPRWPTFGLLLVAPDDHDPLVAGPAQASQPGGRNSLFSFLRSIGRTMMEAHDRLYVEQANFARTIPIDTLGVSTTQFSIDDDAHLKQRLFQSGRDAAAQFLETWDFDAYVKTFRDRPQSTRRERIVEAMADHAAAQASGLRSRRPARSSSSATASSSPPTAP